MMDHLDFDLLAERMLRDYDNHTPGTLFADGLRLSLEDAQRLQDKVARLRQRRSERVVGYKIGSVSPINQRRNGLPHPVWGRLWSTEQHIISETELVCRLLVGQRNWRVALVQNRAAGCHEPL